MQPLVVVSSLQSATRIWASRRLLNCSTADCDLVENGGGRVGVDGVANQAGQGIREAGPTNGRDRDLDGLMSESRTRMPPCGFLGANRDAVYFYSVFLNHSQASRLIRTRQYYAHISFHSIASCRPSRRPYRGVGSRGELLTNPSASLT
jgi:hypothetical protein